MATDKIIVPNIKEFEKALKAINDPNTDISIGGCKIHLGDSKGYSVGYSKNGNSLSIKGFINENGKAATLTYSGGSAFIEKIIKKIKANVTTRTQSIVIKNADELSSKLGYGKKANQFGSLWEEAVYIGLDILGKGQPLNAEVIKGRLSHQYGLLTAQDKQDAATAAYKAVRQFVQNHPSTSVGGVRRIGGGGNPEGDIEVMLAYNTDPEITRIVLELKSYPSVANWVHYVDIKETSFMKTTFLEWLYGGSKLPTWQTKLNNFFKSGQKTWKEYNKTVSPENQLMSKKQWINYLTQSGLYYNFLDNVISSNTAMLLHYILAKGSSASLSQKEMMVQTRNDPGGTYCIVSKDFNTIINDLSSRGLIAEAMSSRMGARFLVPPSNGSKMENLLEIQLQKDSLEQWSADQKGIAATQLNERIALVSVRLNKNFYYGSGNYGSLL